MRPDLELLAGLLDHLGLSARLKGSGPQRRCACPVHRGDGRGRTFSVNLQTNVYQCFDARCQSQGDVIDLWAALHQRDLCQSALDLVRVFGLEPCPPRGPEKRSSYRNGWIADDGPMNVITRVDASIGKPARRVAV